MALLPARKNPSEFDFVSVRFWNDFTGLLGVAKKDALNLFVSIVVGSDDITLLRCGVKTWLDVGTRGRGGIELDELADRHELVDFGRSISWISSFTSYNVKRKDKL